MIMMIKLAIKAIKKYKIQFKVIAFFRCRSELVFLGYPSCPSDSLATPTRS